MSTTYYATINNEKAQLIDACFSGSTQPVKRLNEEIIEVLIMDLSALVQQKARAAYQAIGLPVFVEHGGLWIDHLNGLPGPLIRPIWSQLGPRVCDLIGPGDPRTATARSAVCYCDGKSRRTFVKEVSGTIALTARGTGGVHWEPIFIPYGETLTFAEMALPQKLNFMPLALALKDLRQWLAI